MSNPTLDIALQLKRTGAWALDPSTTFTSFADAQKYAAGNKADPDTRGLCGTSYVGQVISVLADGAVKVYKIEIRVKNAGTAEAPKLELEFYTPDSTTEQGLKESVERLEGDATVEGSVDNKIEAFRTGVLVKDYYTWT